MQRRRYLTAVGLMGLAGCLNTGSDVQDNDGDGIIDSEDYAPNDPEVQEKEDLVTTTATPTTTTTTESTTTDSTTTTTTTEALQAPLIEELNLVYEWVDYGNAVDNAISASAPGITIPIAYRYQPNTRGRELNMTEQVTIFDESNQQMAYKTSTSEQLTEETGRSWEYGQWFETENWSRGTYSAELIIRNNESELVSDPRITSFELRRTLPSRSVEIDRIEAPSRVGVGDPYSFNIHVENSSSRDGGFRSALSARRRGTQWVTYDTPIELNLPTNGTNNWKSGSISFDTAGEIFFRIDELGKTWTLQITQ